MLSQDGATTVEKAFEAGTTPVGVIYNLKFTGMRPALDVEITADYKAIYDGLSGGLNAQPTGLTMVTQQAQSVVREMGYLSDANAELNAL